MFTEFGICLKDTIIEERYFLCSIEPVAELFAIVVRRHWHIENGMDCTGHWISYLGKTGSDPKKRIEYIISHTLKDLDKRKRRL